jgi:integrase
MLLQGILLRAVVRGLIPANPVSVVDKPRQPPTRRPEPLPPITVETIREQLRPRDAMIVSVLAYAGLRPEEAMSARWRDLGDRTLHVYASKTERPRTVRIIQPLAQDLAEWRMASGRPAATALIFPTHDDLTLW